MRFLRHLRLLRKRRKQRKYRLIDSIGGGRRHRHFATTQSAHFCIIDSIGGGRNFAPFLRKRSNSNIYTSIVKEMSSFQNRLIKYGVAGAVNYGALYYLSGGARTVNLLNQTVPLWAAGLGAGVAVRMVSDGIHSWLLPYVPIPEKLKEVGSIGVSLASGAAASVGTMYIANPAIVSESFPRRKNNY